MSGGQNDLNEKPRHRVESRNPAPHPGIDERNSTLVIGFRASLALDAVRQSERARYYSENDARFLTPDWAAKVEPVPYAKLGDPQTLNLYAYLGDNPLSGVDATGHGWWKNFRQRVGNFFTGHGWNTNAELHKITTTVTTTTMGGVVVNGKTYQTYQKTNPDTGKVYSGRTSGTNSPEENVRMRDLNHHMNEEGYGPAKLDKSSTNSDAIRGREWPAPNFRIPIILS